MISEFGIPVLVEAVIVFRARRYLKGSVMAIETVQSLGKEDEKIFERKSDGD